MTEHIARSASDVSLARQVRSLALPVIVHSLLQTLVLFVDRVMLGRYGASSLAAMQIAGSMEWSIWSVCAAFEVGTLARVGRHVGAREPARARQAALLSIGLAAVLGTLVAFATPLVVASMTTFSRGASPSVLDEARAYLELTVAATPVVFVAMTAIATLQASGDTRTPLAIGVFANIIHVGLNRLLILGGLGFSAHGARGAGASTAITFGIQAILALAALCRRDRPVSLRANGGPSGRFREEARSLVRISFPAFIERVLYHAGYLGFVFIIALLGDAAMAANQSLISVEAICFLSGDGFGVAAAALVAQKLGAGRPDAARRAAVIATRDAVLMLTSLGVLVLVLRDVLLPIFSSDADVLAIGRAAVPVLAVAQPFMATGIVVGQSLRGAGQTRKVLGVSVVGALAVRLTMTWFLAIHLRLGLVGVWLGSTCDWAVRSVLLLAIGWQTSPHRLLSLRQRPQGDTL